MQFDFEFRFVFFDLKSERPCFMQSELTKYDRIIFDFWEFDASSRRILGNFQTEKWHAF